MDAIKPIIICSHNTIAKYITVVLLIRFLVPTLYISFMSLINAKELSWIASAILPGLWIICILNLIILLLDTPSLVVYDEGVLLHFPFMKTFINWNEIRLVRRGSYATYIFVTRLGVLNYIAGIAR